MNKKPSTLATLLITFLDMGIWAFFVYFFWNYGAVISFSEMALPITIKQAITIGSAITILKTNFSPTHLKNPY